MIRRRKYLGVLSAAVITTLPIVVVVSCGVEESVFDLGDLKKGDINQFDRIRGAEKLLDAAMNAEYRAYMMKVSRAIRNNEDTDKIPEPTSIMSEDIKIRIISPKDSNLGERVFEFKKEFGIDDVNKAAAKLENFSRKIQRWLKG